MPDYIPESDEKFLVWAQNLHAYALAHAAAMKIETTVIKTFGLVLYGMDYMAASAAGESACGCSVWNGLYGR
jgi:hypothetical protein